VHYSHCYNTPKYAACNPLESGVWWLEEQDRIEQFSSKKNRTTQFYFGGTDWWGPHIREEKKSYIGDVAYQGCYPSLVGSDSSPRCNEQDSQQAEWRWHEDELG
jgi:hypothetical protein